MAFTREQWARDFLAGLGNSNPSPGTLRFVLGWTRAETGGGQGSRFNLLNTTQWAAGATDYNSVGVKNYTSYGQGLQANLQTVQNGLYNPLLQALRTNNETALGAGSGVPSPSILQNLSTWCACGYGRGFANTGGQWAGDIFSYGNQQPIGGGTVQPQPAPSPITKIVQSVTTGVGGSNAVSAATRGVGGTDAGQNLLSQLGGLLDPIRWAKGIFGAVLLIAGLVLALTVLSEKAASSAPIQALGKAAAKVGLAAA